MPDFTDVSSALVSLGVDEDAAELHGTLCGLLCIRDDVSADMWLSPNPGKAGRTAAESPAGDGGTPAYDPLFGSLQDETRRQLNDPEMSFRLLLPDDQYPLPERTGSLVNWCKGFLFGLGTGGFENFEHLPAETNEFLQDLIEITRTSFEAIDATREEEGAYAEIVEYVRIGVLLVHEEIKHVDHGGPEQDSVLH